MKQIEEKRKDVVNQALKRLVKEKDKIWKSIIKELPKYVEGLQWDQLYYIIQYNTDVVVKS